MTAEERKQVMKDKVQLGFIIGMSILLLCKILGGCIRDARKEAAEERERRRAEEKAERERREQEKIRLYKDIDISKPYLPSTEVGFEFYRQYRKKRGEW